MLTKEMQKAKNRLTVLHDTELDFWVGLKVFRVGLIIYGVLPEKDIITMYYRKDKNGEKYIRDKEIDFYLDKGLLKEDFRDKYSETSIKNQLETDNMNNYFKSILEQWDLLKPKAKANHLKKAEKHSHLSYAKKLLALDTERFLGVEC